MQVPEITPTERVRRARDAAMSASSLDAHDRLLLAAAEAADAAVAPQIRAVVACAIVDHGQQAIADATTVRDLAAAVTDALASAELTSSISGSGVTRLVWRLVFDLWGGPDR